MKLEELIRAGLLLVLLWLAAEAIWQRATAFTSRDGMMLQERIDTEISALRGYVDRAFEARVPPPEVCAKLNQFERRVSGLEGREPLYTICRGTLFIEDAVTVPDSVP